MTDAAVAAPRSLGRNDYRTLALAALGGALEFYDFIIFVFFVTVLSGLFFPPEVPEWLRDLQAFGIFAAGYLARPLGGVVMAHFGDKIGRKNIFSLSIFLMALATLGIAMLPTYASIGYAAPILLLSFRVLQGAAIGGEVPGAWVFTAEHVPQKRIGFAVGVLTSGLTSGILIGSLVATAINTIYAPQDVHDFAWRYPFILGGVFGLVSFYLRRWLEETPVFEELRARKALYSGIPLKEVVHRHTPAIVVSMLLSWLLAAVIVTVILMTPTFLQKVYGFTPIEALQANSIATLMLSIGCVLAGLIIDRIGVARFLIAGMIALAAASWALYTLLFTQPHLLLPLYGIAGFTVGSIAAVPYVMVKSFPAQVRFSGVSFSYNVAYAIFGGLTPVLVSYLMTVNRLAPAYYVLAVCAMGLAIGVYLLRREQ